MDVQVENIVGRHEARIAERLVEDVLPFVLRRMSWTESVETKAFDVLDKNTADGKEFVVLRFGLIVDMAKTSAGVSSSTWGVLLSFAALIVQATHLHGNRADESRNFPALVRSHSVVHRDLPMIPLRLQTEQTRFLMLHPNDLLPFWHILCFYIIHVASASFTLAKHTHLSEAIKIPSRSSAAQKFDIGVFTLCIPVRGTNAGASPCSITPVEHLEDGLVIIDIVGGLSTAHAALGDLVVGEGRDEGDDHRAGLCEGEGYRFDEDEDGAVACL